MTIYHIPAWQSRDNIRDQYKGFFESAAEIDPAARVTIDETTKTIEIQSNVPAMREFVSLHGYSRMGRPPEGRSEQLQFFATLEIRRWIESQRQAGESLSETIFIILQAAQAANLVQCRRCGLERVQAGDVE